MRLLTLAIAGSLVVGCTPTTYDESIVTNEDTAPPTSVAVSTDPVEVLPQMLAEVAGLARRVVEGDGDGDAADRIELMWLAIEPTVRDERPELVSGFDFVVRRCRAAADRNRPADADRAFKNLEELVDAYLND